MSCRCRHVFGSGQCSSQAKEWKAWIEAEDYAAQSGSQAAFYRMEETASEGRLVDNNWGRDVGDFLRWSIEISQQCDALYVTIKFARAFPNPASIRVRAGNGQALVQFPTTGGWGFENEQWHYGEIRLEGLSPGRYPVELTSTARDSNLNTDGLFVSNHPLAVEGKKIALEDVDRRRSLAAAAETDSALRRRLLAPYRDRIQRIVFTKHL